MDTMLCCIHLREHDYFDTDYDLHYDPAMSHFCSYFDRPVIPAAECGQQCSGYTCQQVCDTTEGNASRTQAQSKSSSTTKANILDKLDDLVTASMALVRNMRTDADLESESAIQSARVADRAAKAPELARVVDQIRTLTLEIQTTDIRIQEFTRALRLSDFTAWAVWQFGGETPEQVKILLSLKENLRAQIKRLDLQRADLSDGGISPTVALGQLVDEQSRKSAILRILEIAESHLPRALERCQDSLSELESESIERFLDEANRGILHADDGVIDHLQRMPLP